MRGAVFPLCWLFGLRHPRIGANHLLGGARSKRAHVKDCNPISDEVTAFYPDSWCARDLTHPPRVESQFPPVLWNSQSNPTDLQRQIHRGSFPLSDSQAGDPDMGSEFSFRVRELGWYDISSLWVTHLHMYGIWFYCAHGPPTISLWLLLVFGCRISFLIGPSIFLLMLFSN